MTTQGRQVEIVIKIRDLTKCELREIHTNQEVTEFIAEAENGRHSRLQFKGWIFISFPSHKIQATDGTKPAIIF